MGSIAVIKIGGGAGIDAAALAPQIARLIESGEPVVVVHGGSGATDDLAARLGVENRRLVSPSGHESRRTDAAMRDVFAMACAGLSNTRLVAALRSAGVDAVGLSGVDGGVWTAERKGAIRAIEGDRVVIVRDDLSGRVVGVDGALLLGLLEMGRTPVLCPPAITGDGVVVNVDADRAAAATAAAIGASRLLLLSNVPGVLADPSDPASLIEHAAGEGLGRVREAARGRMKNKVLAAEEAIAAGVSHVVIGTAQGPDAVLRAIAGQGTMFEAAEIGA
ncbi:MAG: [LysW]-aminoadipate kinase [Phycisphaerales bacterium]